MKPSLVPLISLLITAVLWFGDFVINQTTSAFVLVLSLSLLCVFLNHWLVPGGLAWSNRSNGPEKIRGPMGWPILGSLPEMVGPLAHRKLAHLASSFGAKRLMALSAGPSTRVIISSHPDTARDILAGPSFADRPVKESARLLMFERAIGFAPGSGPHWRHLRRIASFHMFSPRSIGGLEGLRQRVAESMLSRVVAEARGDRRGVVGLRGVLQEGSLTNMLESVFGGYFGFELEAELGKMVKQGYELISQLNLEDYFPFGFLDFYGVKRRCHGLATKVTSVVGQIVKDRKINTGAIINDSSQNNSNDFLTALLALPKEDQLSDSDTVAILWELIFRGTDTVAILLEWIMARMVLHQDIQAKVQQEIDTCVGGDRHVRDSDVARLPYLQAVVKEVLRLHPPGPLLSWARLAVHDVHVDKVFVPAGTTAMVNMWAISHDPSIWKDPWAFRPNRFIEEEVSVKGSDLRLAPFGSGKRVCPGRELGLATVHLWLARLLQQYTWLPAQPVDLSEVLRLSMEMKNPLLCHVTPRSCNVAI